MGLFLLLTLSWIRYEKLNEMKELSDFSSPEVLEAEAAAWITQLDSDRLPTQSDLAAFREWVSRSPRHRDEVERLASIWGELNILTELIGKDPRPARLKEQTFLGRLGDIVHSLAFYPAMASVLILAGLLVGYTLNRFTDPFAADAEQVYVTAVGEQRRLTLEDGSTVLLNTNTQLEVGYTEGVRKLFLYGGEAHFEVAHDPSRPFEVRALDGVIEAVGTAFSVRLNEFQVEVTVTEGKVRLTKQTTHPQVQTNPSGEPAEFANDAEAASYIEVTVLEPGDSVSYDEGQVAPVVTENKQQLASKLSWHKGMLTFAGEPLEKVVEEVSRYTETSIVIADPAISRLRIGGQFRVDDISQLFAALETVFGIQVVYVDDDIVKLFAHKG